MAGPALRCAAGLLAALEGRDDKAEGFLLFYLTDQLHGIDSGHLERSTRRRSVP